MDKAQKEAQVEEIAQRLGETEVLLAVDYRGISVTDAAELRARLREADASFRVVKNRLAKLAAEKAGREALNDLLEGPTAIAFVKGDIVVAAKAINGFAREHEELAFKGGLMDGDFLDEERFNSLARLPALDVMHGQLVGTVASPLTGLVRGLGSMMAGLAVALGQIQEQGLVGGEEPAAEEPVGGEERVAEEPVGGEEPAAEEPVGEAEAGDEAGESAEKGGGEEDAGPTGAPTGAEGETETSEETENESSPEDAEPEGEASEGSDSEEGE